MIRRAARSLGIRPIMEMEPVRVRPNTFHCVGQSDLSPVHCTINFWGGGGTHSGQEVDKWNCPVDNPGWRHTFTLQLWMKSVWTNHTGLSDVEHLWAGLSRMTTAVVHKPRWLLLTTSLWSQQETRWTFLPVELGSRGFCPFQ